MGSGIYEAMHMGNDCPQKKADAFILKVSVKWSNYYFVLKV